MTRSTRGYNNFSSLDLKRHKGPTVGHVKGGRATVMFIKKRVRTILLLMCFSYWTRTVYS